MRILYYVPGIPPAMGGGLIKYALDLAREEKMLGNKVFLLCPGGKNSLRKRMSITKRGEIDGIDLYRIGNSLPVPIMGIKKPELFMEMGDLSVYIGWLRDIKPDIIHLHSFMGVHREFLIAAKMLMVPITYTVHDYFGICPNINLLCDGTLCVNQSGELCGKCCRNSAKNEKLENILGKIYLSLSKQNGAKAILQNERILRWMTKVKKMGNSRPRRDLLPKQMEDNKSFFDLKKYYAEMFELVDLFQFNSRQSEKIFKDSIKISYGCVIDITHKDISDKRMKKSFGNVLRLSYLGTLREIKGFQLLKESLDQLYLNRKNFILNVFFSTRQENDAYIHYQLPYSYDQLAQVMENTDLLIIPSICMETFGLVVKEAISYGVPCVLTECVGAKDWVNQFPDISMVIPCTKDALVNVLKKIYDNRELLKTMNEHILEIDYDFSFLAHVQKINMLYSSIRKEKT
ncbi:MAG: glycosyltransferase [Eubacteriales bacterium]|nr:glycosyltransferase [Eubacteriales bacterium]